MFDAHLKNYNFWITIILIGVVDDDQASSCLFLWWGWCSLLCVSWIELLTWTVCVCIQETQEDEMIHLMGPSFSGISNIQLTVWLISDSAFLITVSLPAPAVAVTLTIATLHPIQTWSRGGSIINRHRVQRSQGVSFYKCASRTDSRRLRVQMLQHQSSPWYPEQEMKERVEGAWKRRQRLRGEQKEANPVLFNNGVGSFYSSVDFCRVIRFRFSILPI